MGWFSIVLPCFTHTNPILFAVVLHHLVSIFYNSIALPWSHNGLLLTIQERLRTFLPRRIEPAKSQPVDFLISVGDHHHRSWHIPAGTSWNQHEPVPSTALMPLLEQYHQSFPQMNIMNGSDGFDPFHPFPGWLRGGSIRPGGTPRTGGLVRENPMKIDDLGLPPF